MMRYAILCWKGFSSTRVKFNRILYPPSFSFFLLFFFFWVIFNPGVFCHLKRQSFWAPFTFLFSYFNHILKRKGHIYTHKHSYGEILHNTQKNWLCSFIRYFQIGLGLLMVNSKIIFISFFLFLMVCNVTWQYIQKKKKFNEFCVNWSQFHHRFLFKKLHMLKDFGQKSP